MYEFTGYNALFSDVFHIILNSLLFSLFIRVVFLLIVLKITDIVISKIQIRIVHKSDSHEAKKQIVTILL